MKSQKKHFFLILVLCFSSGGMNFSHAQNSKIDSVQNLIKTDKEDTNKVMHLNELCANYNSVGSLDTSIYYGQSGLELAKKIGFKKGMILCHSTLGNAFYHKGNYPEALKNNFASLKLSEETGDKKRIAISLGNIGIVYTAMQNNPEATKYLEASLKIKKEMNDKRGIAATTNNLGAVYSRLGDDAKAKVFYPEALALWTELGNKQGIAYCYNNLAAIDINLGDYDEALKKSLVSLKIKEELGDQQGMAITYTGLGNLNIRLKKYSLAQEYLDKSFKLATDIGAISEITDCYQTLAMLDSASGNFKLAYEHYKLYVVYRDSIDSEEHTKETVQTQMQYEFDKKQTADSIKNSEQIKQEEQKHEQEIQQQKIYSYGGAIGFALMLIVAIVSYRAFRQKQKANYFIAEQKAIVDEKQKQIIDSIHYAKRIQQSLLPTEKYIQRSLKRLKKK